MVQAAEGQGLLTLLEWRRREPVFLSSRNEERTVMTYWSDERRRNGENRPRPSGFNPNTQRSRAGDPGLWRKSGHTSFSPSTVGPPQPSGSVSSGRIFAHNAIHPSSVSRPSATCENAQGQDAGRSRGERRPVRDLQRRGRGRSGHPRGRPRSSSSRAPSSRYSSSRPPTHSPLRGMGECTLPARRRRFRRELPGRAPRSSPELRLSKLLPTSTASCCPYSLQSRRAIFWSAPAPTPPSVGTPVRPPPWGWPVLPYANTSGSKGCGGGAQINLRNFS